MAEETKVFILDKNSNAFEGMTKEQILSAITQAVKDGTISDVDSGFVTKIQEKNGKEPLQFWVGSMAEFQGLPKTENTLYLLSDDPTIDDLTATVDEYKQQFDQLQSDVNQSIANLQKVLNDSIVYVHNISYTASGVKEGTIAITLSVKGKKNKFQTVADILNAIGETEIIASGTFYDSSFGTCVITTAYNFENKNGILCFKGWYLKDNNVVSFDTGQNKNFYLQSIDKIIDVVS